MNRFRVTPLPQTVADHIRATMKDNFGHELTKVKLASRALCRFCLHDGNPDVQKHILFSYMPVEQDKNPYAEVGPVYIHDTCDQYKNTSVFPPDLKKRQYLTVRGYDAEQMLVAGVMSEGAAVEDAIDKLFDNKIIQYLHIGDATTGCYFLKVERP